MNKKGDEDSAFSNYLIWILLGAVALIIIFIVIGVLSGKNSGAAAFINDLFNFR